ncbi:MAG: hypothetical protein WC332_03000 [Clostridia bacterium]
MTTSGTTTWNPVRDQILKRSLRLVHAYPATGNPRPEQLIDAKFACNSMLKSWQTDGLLWLKQDATLFLNEGQAVYNLAPTTYTGFSHCATSYVQTTLNGALEVGDSTATLTSVTGISSTDYIGIENDNGIIEWFTGTVSGYDVALSSTIGVACADGNLVYAHTTTTQIQRPTRVEANFKYYNSTAADGTERPIDMVSKSDYDILPSKTSTGKIVQAYYDPQLVCGKLYVWPCADYCGDKLVLTIDRPVDDLLADTETIDAPLEWIEAITYCLADRIAPEYQLPLQERAFLKGEAEKAYNRILSFNREGSIFFEV